MSNNQGEKVLIFFAWNWKFVLMKCTLLEGSFCNGPWIKFTILDPSSKKPITSKEIFIIFSYDIMKRLSKVFYVFIPPFLSKFLHFHKMFEGLSYIMTMGKPIWDKVNCLMHCLYFFHNCEYALLLNRRS